MNSLATRIKERMKALGMTQEMLANKMGITRGAITHYLAARRTPPLSQFKKLATILKVEPAWLHYGTVVKEAISKTDKSASSPKKPIPVLSWEQVVEFMDASKISAEIKKYVPGFFTEYARWYALTVKGDSMVSPIGNTHTFLEGDLLIIDPDKEVSHGNFVVALLPKAKEAIFKQYVLDGGKRYLKPLNPQYPLIEIDEGTYIYGVIIGCFKMLLSSLENY